MTFKEKTKDCQLIVRVKASFREEIDEKELDRFSRLLLRGFLKPRTINKKQIEYYGPVGVSLYDRLKKTISKRDFLFIVEQIVVAVQKLQANDLAINNCVLSLQHVYINEVTKEVQFIYIPTVKSNDDYKLIQFIESIVYSVKTVDEGDAEFFTRFIYYFKAISPFDITKLESFVIKEDGNIVKTIKKQNVGQSGFMTDKPLDYYEHYSGEENDDERTGFLEEDEETGYLEDNEETGKLDEDDATGLLVENGLVEHFSTLYRVTTNETIIVNKPVFRLGKERSYVDYFVTNNVAVSRSHADIITRGEHFFVKDLNSKNHTFVNGREILPHIEAELHDGDELLLGNEKFVFKI